MNDYILFDAALRDRFLGFLGARGVPCGARPDRIEGFVVSVPDDLAEELDAAIEAEYEALMSEQQALVESAGADGAPALMSVEVELADGSALTVHLPARYARRLNEHFSIDEIRGLVAVIAQSVIDPASGPTCCRT